MFKKLINRLSRKQPEEAETPQALSDTPAQVAPEPAEQPVNQDETKPEELADTDALAAKSADAAPSEPIDKEELKNRIIDMVKTIFDPEIPVNVYDIGLIYKIEPHDDGMVEMVMTLTSPNCPAAGILPGEVESKARSVDGVRDVEFELTFDPPWNPEMMSEGAKLELGMM
jgi:FeS assembly SUF system protein